MIEDALRLKESQEYFQNGKKQQNLGRLRKRSPRLSVQPTSLRRHSSTVIPN